MTGRRNGKQRIPVQNTIRISRPVDYKDEAIQLFTNSVGRAISGAGTTRSVGSMSVTLLGGTGFDRLRRRMTMPDQRKIDIDDLVEKFRATLKLRPQTPNLNVEGVGLFGHKTGKRWHPVVRLGFSAILGANEPIKGDLEAINTVLSDANIPTVGNDPRRDLHISFGDVYTDRLTRGQGENPHLLIPSGVTIPETIGLYKPKVDPVAYDGMDELGR